MAQDVMLHGIVVLILVYQLVFLNRLIQQNNQLKRCLHCKFKQRIFFRNLETLRLTNNTDLLT